MGRVWFRFLDTISNWVVSCLGPKDTNTIRTRHEHDAKYELSSLAKSSIWPALGDLFINLMEEFRWISGENSTLDFWQLLALSLLVDCMNILNSLASQLIFTIMEFKMKDRPFGLSFNLDTQSYAKKILKLSCAYRIQICRNLIC